MSHPEIPRTALVTGGSRGLGVAIAIRQLDFGQGCPGLAHSVLGMEARLRRHRSQSGCPGWLPGFDPTERQARPARQVSSTPAGGVRYSKAPENPPVWES